MSSDEENDTLTPWQKEHLLYLESEGIQPDEEVEENEEDQPSEELSEDVSEEEAVDDSEGKRFSFSDHLPNLKAYRDKKLRGRLLLIVSLYLLPLTASLYYISPLSKLSAITVEGTTVTEKEALISSSQLKEQEGLWPQFFNRKSLVASIEAENPRVKSAEIGLKHWNQFAITVQEYPEVAYLVKGNQYLPILENGLVLQEPRKEVSNGRVILENYSDETRILDTLEAYRELPSEIQDAISQIKYAPSKKNRELLTIFMNDGNQVLVGISKLTTQMKYYLQVAKEMDEKGVIDMEVGIFSYPYSLKEEENKEKMASSESF